MSRYNLDKLIRVDLITKKADDDFKFIPEKNILGLFKIKPCIKTFFTKHPLDFFLDNFPSYMVENGIVFRRFSVRLNFEHGYSFRKYFETYSETTKYRDDITNNFKWIEG